MSARALEALDRILGGGGEADDVLRAAIEVLVEEPSVEWAAVAFVESGSLVPGPKAGTPDEARRVRIPIAFQGAPVGELWVDGDADCELLEQVAARISTHVLIGWDTSGEPWDP